MQPENNSTITFPLIGKTLPDFELEAYLPVGDKLSKLKLGSFKGKWLVILFYPSNFTYVCPTELEEAAEYYSKFKKLGAEILSVSTDSAFAHKAWHDNSEAIKKIKFPMIADPTGKLLPYAWYIYRGRRHFSSRYLYHRPRSNHQGIRCSR